jgi:ATP-binding cassette subfamily B protein
MKTFETIIPFLKKNIGKYIIGILLLITVDIAQLIIPRLMQVAIDRIEMGTIDQVGLFYVGLIILGLSALMVVIRYFWRVIFIGVAWSIDRDLRKQYYKHLLGLSQNFFNRQKIGDLMAYATNDLNAVRMMVGFGMVMVVDITFLTLATASFMASYNVQLTLMAIIPLPFLSLMIIFFGRKIHARFSQVQKLFATLSGKVQEGLSGIRVVKAFAQEKPETEKMSETALGYAEENIGMIKLSQGLFRPLMFLFVSMSMLIVLVFGGSLAILGDISMGEFIAFFQYLGMLIWPMIAIGWIVNMYQRGTASLKRINSIFEEKPEIVDESSDKSIKEIKGNIEVKNLKFKYTEPGPWIFKGISFQIKAGQTLAVVGRTGTGKSTLVDLLLRIYNPPRDSIYIDGNEIFSIPLNTLRNNMILVPQDIFLFSNTISENIRLGKPDATQEEIEEVARKVHIYEDISEFEYGFETIVGERGVTLSGGQKQRLAIARALLTDPSVLILDDALSAVDTKTEKGILKELIDMRKDSTTIIIAHRISSLRHANQIIVLEDGYIAESGTHLQLLRLGGLYRDLYEKQKIEEKLKGRNG